MQVTETKAEGLRHEFSIVVPAATIEESMTKRLQTLAREVKLPGFRPGKVPMQIVRQRFGTAVRGEVLQELVDEQSRKTLSDRGLEAAYRPDVQLQSDAAADGDLAFTLAVDVMPDIPEFDFATLSLERMSADVTDEMVDEDVARIASANKRYEPLADPRPSEEGDLLVVDYRLSVEGGSAVDEPVTDFRLELGSGTLPETVESALAGTQAGDERSASVPFPDNHPNPEFAGRDVAYTVTVKEVQAPASAPEGDALATELGLSSLEELRETLRSRHERELGRLARERLKRQLLDKLAGVFDFPVPQRLVDADFEGIWKQIESARERQSEGAEAADPDLAKPDDELRAEYRAIAERRVRLGLLLANVGKSSGITVSSEELNSALIAEAMKFPGQEKQIYEAYRQIPSAVEQLRERVLEDKVVDYIVELADVSETTVTAEELLREPEDDTPMSATPSEMSPEPAEEDQPAADDVEDDQSR